MVKTLEARDHEDRANERRGLFSDNLASVRLIEVPPREKAREDSIPAPPLGSIRPLPGIILVGIRRDHGAGDKCEGWRG